MAATGPCRASGEWAPGQKCLFRRRCATPFARRASVWRRVGGSVGDRLGVRWRGSEVELASILGSTVCHLAHVSFRIEGCATSSHGGGLLSTWGQPRSTSRKSGRIRVKFARNRANTVRLRSNSGHMCPNLEPIRPTYIGHSSPESTDLSLLSNDVAPMFCQHRPGIEHTRPEIDQHLPELARNRPNLIRRRPSSARSVSNLARHRVPSYLANTGPESPPELTWNRLTLVRI